MDPTIFKAYDIRGTYPDQLDEEVATTIGRAIAAYLNVPQIAVGRDMRLSSPALARALMQGLTDRGTDVVELGLTSTDELYFAVGKYGYAAGVMVSASHNPRQYNGFKLCRAGAVPISSETGLAEIAALAEKGSFPTPPKKGTIQSRDVLAGFVDEVLSFIDPAQVKPLTVVVDAGNGMAGMTAPAVFKRLPCRLIPLYFELDGSFPHHPASPIEPENMVDLQRAVREHKADLGVAFDGDADRMFVVDEQAELVDGSMITALVSRSLLQKYPGSTILYNLIVSRSVPELIERMGGVAVRTRVGHSFIKQIMRERNAIFGGEHSGHFYFRDFWFADSGMIALLVVLELVSQEGTTVSALIRSLDTRVRSGEINTHVADIPGKLAEIERHYADGAIDHLDGTTVNYPTWWFNVRPSNTEPLLRLNVEADNRALMEQKRDEVLAIIRE
jgi:phosphomannomutase